MDRQERLCFLTFYEGHLQQHRNQWLSPDQEWLYHSDGLSYRVQNNQYIEFLAFYDSFKVQFREPPPSQLAPLCLDTQYQDKLASLKQHCTAEDTT